MSLSQLQRLRLVSPLQFPTTSRDPERYLQFERFRVISAAQLPTNTELVKKAEELEDDLKNAPKLGH